MEITVLRDRAWFGRKRELRLLVDDVEVGRLHQKQKLTISVPDGAQRLVAEMGRGRTDPFALDGLTDGATLHIGGYLTFNLLRNVGVVFLPLQIRRVDPDT